MSSHKQYTFKKILLFFLNFFIRTEQKTLDVFYYC